MRHMLCCLIKLDLEQNKRTRTWRMFRCESLRPGARAEADIASTSVGSLNWGAHNEVRQATKSVQGIQAMMKETLDKGAIWKLVEWPRMSHSGLCFRGLPL
jgi:hypothetical protein